MKPLISSGNVKAAQEQDSTEGDPTSCVALHLNL